MDAILRVITNSTLLVTKFLRMGLADKNDHPPFFKHQLYEVEVDEDEQINTIILNLNATDFDEVSHLYYDIVEGNDEGTFAVGNFSGDIYLAQPLDYETTNKYTLLLAVSDGRHQSGTHIRINVRDVNDNPPEFDSRLYQVNITEEDDRDLPRRIIKVSVTDRDIDRKNDVVFSLSGQGIDVENPQNSHFQIHPSSGEIFVKKPLDRDFPGGRPRWGLSVFAQDEGGTGLVSYSEIVINLKDVNDNPPRFHQIVYYGNVTENGTRGLEVITLKANDYDDPNEGTNAKVSYSIEKNVIDEVTGEALFMVEPDTGVIRTSVCCLDREETQNYLIQVVAQDGGGLKGTGTVSINVLDINDKPPMFSKEEWITETEETDGSVLYDHPILTVFVLDDDEKNNFSYKVVDDSGFGSDKFQMIDNPDGTGSLKVIQPLDFEDPKQRAGFRFQIQVNDMGDTSVTEPYHMARSWVTVMLKDINDNEPKFLKRNNQVSVYENSPIGTSLATILAIDPDKQGTGKVSYSIDRLSDKYRHFHIEKSGMLKTQRTLDREKISIYYLNILAIDDALPAKTATLTFTVNVKDINDNSPTFLENYRPVLPENHPPTKVTEILATDSDDHTLRNGPPYHFRLDPKASAEIKSSFKVENIPRGLNEEGMAVVFSLREFDREEQKEYFVPIEIRDSGVPSMVGTSTLTVTIGDENDNSMQSGEKEILFYSYMGQTHGTSIGRVYVEDLDDWDSIDKTFVWAGSPHPNFKLDENNGMIVMKYVPNESSYKLEFLVHDRIHNHSHVKASVTVNVRHIPEVAVNNAGSIRIENMTDKDFINQWDHESNKKIQSKANKFRDKLAKLFGLNIYSVDLFSIQMVQEYPPVTDVFFSVYDLTYYLKEKLNGVVMKYKDEIEKTVEIKILVVGINECLNENYPCDGSCTNRFKVSKSQYMIDANRTSFVGVHAQIVPECVCDARYFPTEESCRPNPCLNGGRCVEGRFNIHCQCLEGYEGPRCQMLTRTFNGKGFAWFPSIEGCENSHVSVEFISKQPNGLLFYNGPIAPPIRGDTITTDFIALELDRGDLRLLIDFGSGTLQLKLNTSETLNDGNWHRVDIYWDKETVKLTVNLCKEAAIHRSDAKSRNLPDVSRCQAIGSIPQFNEYLNVNSPLQVGGLAHPALPNGSYRWHHIPHANHFDGCIRNLIINSRLYDFANPALQSNTKLGCPHFDRVCNNNSTITAGCGPNGLCSGSVTSPVCQCNPGWTGSACDEPTIPAFFENQSFVKYSLSFEPSTFHMDIQLRIRTWEETGEILRITGEYNGVYGILEISDSHLLFRYNMEPQVVGEKQITLSSVFVSDGMWHLVKVMRYGSTVILTLDGGEGRRYNETPTFSDHTLMDVSVQGGVTMGGNVLFSNIDDFSVQNDLELSCIDDVRIDGKSLPLPPSLSATQFAQATAFHNLASHCISHDQCLNIECLAPLTCKDLWMKHECGCPAGSVLSKDQRACLDEDECLSYPCENNGICQNQQPSYICQCPTGYFGQNCELIQESTPLQPNLQALSAVFICIIIVLFFLISFLLCVCCKRRLRYFKDKDSETNAKYKENSGGEPNEGEVTFLDLTALSIPTVSVVANGGTSIQKINDVRFDVDVAVANLDVVVATTLERKLKSPPHQHQEENSHIHLHHPKDLSACDDLRNYAYEGGGGSSSAVNSLSSLGSGTDSNSKEQSFDDPVRFVSPLDCNSTFKKQGGFTDEDAVVTSVGGKKGVT